MELGAYSFGDTPRNPDGSLRPTAEAISNLHEAIILADQNGLDYFGVGEHHTLDMPASSPGSVIAPRRRQRSKSNSAVARASSAPTTPYGCSSSSPPADAVSGGGRVEIIAGRGSSVETFPLFGYDLKDYDRLYAEKLDLLMSINNSTAENVTWSGTVRPALHELAVVPRPVNGSLPVWVATGGSAPSSVRAGKLGLPISYGIIGGAPARFAPLADLYRQTAAQAGHTGENIKVSVATLGLVAPTKKEALERFYPGWVNLNIEMGKLRGWPAPDKRQFLAQADFPGAYYVGDPDEIAQRIADLHGHMGHMRHFLQMDIGGLPQEHFLESLTLLATEVKPRVERLLAGK
ncbi:LLM class flavin-dependent oxidoreductase [Microbacterium sp. CH12i]|uniref:LLM class flavin-dependent oxidoreductase n=1 Tax=Microbacterium sp. CH12i TaxID=1479651 RepID=UPI000AF7DA33|nr:LLM class flavin-dependent oxidoreductase [Microbacterium sp. CH12i]